jgi:hypothetical protein
MDVHITPVNNPPRRWLRHRLDVPLRVIIHTPDKTIIREGRGCELGGGGMSFAAGVELKTGDQVEIEFTPAYSGRPIRVRAVARNGNGYIYGAEFVASSDQERQEISSLRENLQTLSSAYSPSYSPPSRQSAQASERRRDAQPRSPAEHAAALLNVSSRHAPNCSPLPAESCNPVGKSRRGGQRPQLRSIRKKLGTISPVPTETPSARDGGPGTPAWGGHDVRNLVTGERS